MHTGQIISHLAVKRTHFFGRGEIQLLHSECHAGFCFVFRQRKRLSYPKWMGETLPKQMVRRASRWSGASAGGRAGSPGMRVPSGEGGWVDEAGHGPVHGHQPRSLGGFRA